jgi:VanZ family protein
VYAAAVFAASAAPVAAPPQAGLYFDKLVHLAVYLLLGALWLAAWRAGAPGARRTAAVWAAATAYGALIEAVQAVLPWRSAEAADVLMNAVGAAVGVWVGSRLMEPR